MFKITTQIHHSSLVDIHVIKQNVLKIKQYQRTFDILLKEKNSDLFSEERRRIIDKIQFSKLVIKKHCNVETHKIIKVSLYNKLTGNNYTYDYEVYHHMSLRDRLYLFKRAKETVRRYLHEYRVENRQIIPNRKQYYLQNNADYIKYNMIGLVHEKAGDFVKFKERKRYNEVFKYKQPRYEDKNNYVGIELEFVSPEDHDELARMFVKRNVENYVTLKHDGSIAHDDEGEYSAEVAIYCKDTEYDKVVANVLDVIHDAGGYINKSCGMHVHLDMRNRDVARCYKNLVKSQSILYAMQPASRRKNKYCKRSNGSIFSSHGRNRYKGINNTAYSKHKTLEVRMHSGTLDVDKVTNWVKLLLNIVNLNESIERAPTKLSSFIKKFNIDIELAQYIAQRIEKFNAVDETQQRIQENREISQEQAA